MGNPFVPFPRNERIIIAGDTATEILSALRIFGLGLIGGEVPSMELLHPNEKHLECVSCFLNDPKQVLLPAVRRTGAEYVLLEDNGTPDFNPAAAKDALGAMGVKTKILDVKGTPEEVLRRAGAMFGEERQAERVIREMEERRAALQDVHVCQGQTALILLGIRNPTRHESYVFRVAGHSDLSGLVGDAFGVKNLFDAPAEKDLVPGVQELGSAAEFLSADPDFIALTGDAAACSKEIAKALRENPGLQNLRAIREGRVCALPYYCRPLAWRAPVLLEAWADALL